MQTRLSFTTLTTTLKPITTASVNFLYTTKDGRRVFFPLRADNCGWVGLRRMNSGAAPTMHKNIMGKSSAFVMTRPEPILLQFRLAKSGGGYGDIARFLYALATPDVTHGTIQMRVLDTILTVAEGPLRLLDTLEAMDLAGAQFKGAIEFNPAVDCAKLGVILTGVQGPLPMGTRTTIGENGEVTTVRVRRNPRQIGI